MAVPCCFLLTCPRLCDWSTVRLRRVDFMEQSPNINRLFHLRMVGISAVLASADAYMVYTAATTLMVTGPSMQLLFGFEYIVLLTMIVATSVKYSLQVCAPPLSSFDALSHWRLGGALR